MTALLRFFHALLPVWIRDRYIAQFDRTGLAKYARNTGWLFFGKLVSYPLALFSMAIVARYLGPTELGQLSYAQSFVAIFVALAALGIDEIVSRDLVRHPERERDILGTAFVTKLVAGLVMFVVISITSWLIHPDSVIHWLVMISALTIILNPFTITGQVFSARAISKFGVIATIIVGIVLPLLKIGLAITNQSVYWFAAMLAVETILAAALSWYFYRRYFGGHVRTWCFSPTILRSLLAVSWPLMIANSINVIFFRVDQIMLQYLSNSTEVGYYSAATRVTETWLFIPAILSTALYPAVVAHKETNPAMYRKRFRDLTFITLLFSVSFSILIFLAAPWIINSLFGPEFGPSIAILYVHVWIGVILSLYIIAKLYLVSESKTKFIFIMSIVGTLSNVTLNYLLIPIYGGVGAAYATLLANVIMISMVLMIRSKRICRV